LLGAEPFARHHSSLQEFLMPNSFERLWQRLRFRMKASPIQEISSAHSSATNRLDFQRIADNSADVILLVGADMRARYASPSSREILGWEPDELVGKLPKEIFLPEDLPIVESAAATLYSREVSTAVPTARIRCKDGTIKWCESHARLLSDPSSEFGDVVVVIRDVTERVELENRLAQLAMTDALTSLSNRRAFDEAILREWRASLRTGQPISLLLLDVDNFKAFNDHYGHQVGDDCLKTIASCVAATVQRPRDFVARYGGEEIAVILPETYLDGAQYVAESVRRAVEELQLPHVGNPEGSGFVTVSVGVTTALSTAGGTIVMPESLLLTVDGALYKAKQNGRNRIESSILFTPESKNANTSPAVKDQMAPGPGIHPE
jgi:diguanylate cyclase (GGDEF)-like protein/PAS domain S-box-containing protein